MLKIFFMVSVLYALSISVGTVGFAATLSPRLQAAIDSSVAEGELPVILTFKNQPDVENLAVHGKGREEARALARAHLIRTLREHADGAGNDVVRFLREQGIRGEKSLWILNGLALRIPVSLISQLSAQPSVDSVDLDATIQIGTVSPQVASGTVQWNIAEVRAPDLWAQGFDGGSSAGNEVVVGIMDSGVDVDHPDLTTRWRGGSNSWYDPYRNTTLPYDPLYSGDPSGSGHGTAVTGVILGGNASGAYIGVAPGAKWIAAKIFDDTGAASTSSIHESFQWMLDPDGNPDTDDAPDIVNNSWGYDNETNTCITDLRQDVQTLKAAGIAVVFAAGNTGTSGDISPANYPESLAVGSVDSHLSLSDFSAVGPSACDGTIYPELVAPGELIKTATIDAAAPYAYYAGTSFSTPHVAGVMALLLDAYPNLSVSELESALKASATDLGDSGPDNLYGYGLVNALAAYTQINVPPSAAQLRAPDNGVVLSGTAVDFEWARGTDANGDVLTETLVYADNPDFLSKTSIDTSNVESTPLLLGLGLFFGAIVPMKRKHGRKMIFLFVLMATGLFLYACGGGGGSSDNPATPLQIVNYRVEGLGPGTYYWKVVTEDTHGAMSESEVWTFTLQ